MVLLALVWVSGLVFVLVPVLVLFSPLLLSLVLWLFFVAGCVVVMVCNNLIATAGRTAVMTTARETASGALDMGDVPAGLQPIIAQLKGELKRRGAVGIIGLSRRFRAAMMADLVASAAVSLNKNAAKASERTQGPDA